jgi:hypothetical protein
MQLEPAYLAKLAVKTISEPRNVPRQLFDFGLPRETLLTMLLLVIILNAALGVVSSLLFPLPPEYMGGLLGNPLQMSLIEAFFMIFLACSIFYIGKLFGGQGTLNEAIMTVVWIEGIFIVLQFATLVLTIIAPVLALLTMLISFVLFFWILSHFTAESHDFKSAGQVFIGSVGFMFVIVFALSFVLVLLGVEPIQLPIQN